jgi:hypothetical protein
VGQAPVAWCVVGHRRSPELFLSALRSNPSP